MASTVQPSVRATYEVVGYAPPPLPPNTVRAVFSPAYQAWDVKKEHVTYFLTNNYGPKEDGTPTLPKPLRVLRTHDGGPHYTVVYCPDADLSVFHTEQVTVRHKTFDLGLYVEPHGQPMTTIHVDHVPDCICIDVLQRSLADLAGCTFASVRLKLLAGGDDSQWEARLPVDTTQLPDWYTIDFRKDGLQKTAHLILKLRGRRTPCSRCGLRNCGAYGWLVPIDLFCQEEAEVGPRS